MNIEKLRKQTVLYYVLLSVSLASAFFALNVLIGETNFSFANLVPFLVSALIGTIIGVSSFQLIGCRFKRFQLLSSVIPAVLLFIIVTKSGLLDSWKIDDATSLILTVLVICNSINHRKKSI